MKDQILKATGDELSRLAGEVLQPDNKSQYCYTKDDKHLCSMCHKDIKLNDCDKSCNFSLIRLTWPEAMKWRDWAASDDADEDSRFAFIAGLETIWRSGDMELCFEQWVICNAQPEHYIKAACLCKIGTQSNGKEVT